MSEVSKKLLDELRSLENRINKEISAKQLELNYQIEKRKVKFEKEQIAKFKELKTGLIAYLLDASFVTILTAPFVYFIFFPALLFDLSASLYQKVCFPIYKIPKVKRSEYVVIDRHQLKYLNLIERINCAYCGYVNGVIAYIREIGSRTEQYWCPIRHALKARGVHQRHYQYIPYGDSENYQAKLQELRDEIRKLN